MKQWIRWSGLLGFIAIIALLVVGWMFVAGPLIKYSIETFGSKAANAKVEVEDVSLSFAPMGIEITGLQVANADKPMENIFQFDRAVADLEFLPLLLGKGIVNEVVLSGVAFSTPRQSSGALLDDRDDDAEKTSSAKNESFINPDSINQALPSADELLAREPLLTEQRGRAFQQSFKTIKTDSDNAIAALPGNEDFAAYEDEFNRLTSGKFDSVEDFQQRKKEFDALKKRIKKDQKAISEASKVIANGKETLQGQWSGLQAAPGEDFSNLKSKYKLDGAGVANLSRLLFGDQVGEWSQKGLYWYEKVSPFLVSDDGGEKESEEEKIKRTQGRFIHFETDRPLPDLLIRQAQLAVQLEVGEVGVQVFDITHQQAVIGRPIRIIAKGNALKSIESLAINGTLDRRVSPGKDTFDLSLQGMALNNYDVGAMGLKLDRSQLNVVGDAELISGEINANTVADFSQAQFSSKDKTLVAIETTKALAKIDRFDIRATAKGKLKAPGVDIKSNLDTQLSEAFNKRLKEKQQELEVKLKEGLNEKLLSYAGDYKDQLKAMDLAGGSLADKQAKLKEMASSELTSFADQQKADAQRKLDEKKKAEQKKAQEKADKKKKQLQNEAKEKLMNLF